MKALKTIMVFAVLGVLTLFLASSAQAEHKDVSQIYDAANNWVGYAAFAEYEGRYELVVNLDMQSLGTGDYEMTLHEEMDCTSDAVASLGKIRVYRGIGFYSNDSTGLPRSAIAGSGGSAISITNADGWLACGLFFQNADVVAEAGDADMDMGDMDMGDTPAPVPTDGTLTALTPAADLRVALTKLLGEHVLLASSATGAALDGRQAEFEAAAAALDANSVDISAAIGSVYGAEAETAFLALWREHIGFFVDYTVAQATRDSAAKQNALRNLDGYTSEAATFLSGANPFIDADTLNSNLDAHITTLTAVIDDQSYGNQWGAYANLQKAFNHMQGSGLFLSSAIAQQFPETFPGDAASPTADLRVAQNMLSAEHVYLAAAATNAALGGRDAEFMAAGAALDRNGRDIAGAIGSLYGAENGAIFLGAWRDHIGFFVDYTIGVATSDEAAKAKALADLEGYEEIASSFLAGANPFLDKNGVQMLLAGHVKTLTPVIDAQGAGDQATAYSQLRTAYGHMQMLSDALSEAIVMQFPDAFK